MTPSAALLGWLVSLLVCVACGHLSRAWFDHDELWSLPLFGLAFLGLMAATGGVLYFATAFFAALYRSAL